MPSRKNSANQMGGHGDPPLQNSIWILSNLRLFSAAVNSRPTDFTNFHFTNIDGACYAAALQNKGI